ncbi:hypothetical protein JCM17961_01750 [Endothiovibrio diazotrophicus]
MRAVMNGGTALMLMEKIRSKAAPLDIDPTQPKAWQGTPGFPFVLPRKTIYP